ncbi:GTP cyclohydrolase I, partial [Klebsiella pneumoniae]|uniref:GTP cyclohydrolase I n=1 Tax=Klebsiella pneumoniae TaxID=573 RepID=UPI003012C625
MNIQIRDVSGQSSGMPSQEEAEAAFRTISRWVGENPDRPGLIETPSRAARAFREYCSGYEKDPLAILN